MRRSLFLLVMLGLIFIGQAGIATAQWFDPDAAVLLDESPAVGTFYSLNGDCPPLPYNPLPDSATFYDGIPGQFWYASDVTSGRRSFAEDEGPPDLPPGGSDGGGTDGYSNSYNLPVYTLTTNFYQFSNYWLAISASPTNSQTGLIMIESTLPGIYYSVLTNADLNTTTWGLLTTVLATSTNTPVPPVDMSSLQHLAYRGQIVFPPSNGYAVTNGLVAYWKLHESQGTNAYDSSGSNNTLSLSNAPYWGPGYVILNGTNQYGDAGTNAAEISYQDMTICAWINQTSNAYKGIVDKSFDILGIGSGGWGMWIEADGHLLFHGYNYSCVDNGPVTVIPNQWTFVTTVWHYSAQTADFYIDGVLNTNVHNSSVKNWPTSGYADALVGNIQNNLSNGLYCFNGSLRDIGIYNRALSAAEVRSNYLATEYNTNVNLPDVLYYKMTEYDPANPTNYPFSLTDSSIHGGTTGTYGGTVLHSEIWTNNPAGTSNTALHFSGGTGVPGTQSGTYIETSNSVLFNFTTNSFTINLWLDGFTADGYIVGNDTYLSNGWFMALAGNKLYFGSQASGTQTYINTVDNVPYADNTVGIYNMVTVTRNGTNTPIIYLNAVPVAVAGNYVSPASSTNTLKFARGINANSYDLDGDIWLPQIWTNALSPRDIDNLYCRQLLGVPWP